MENRILIIFAHPKFERSLNQSSLIKYIPEIPEITFHDLYEKYPDFFVDIKSEQELLDNHQIIVLQHPFYWYSTPPLLKQWIDLVLEFGWAYGPGGNHLAGKLIFNVLTAGGQRSAYSKKGHNRFTINQLLAPIEQTARLCQMTWLPPFVIHGTHRITDPERTDYGMLYNEILLKLARGSFETGEIQSLEYMNDWVIRDTKMKK